MIAFFLTLVFFYLVNTVLPLLLRCLHLSFLHFYPHCEFDHFGLKSKSNADSKLEVSVCGEIKLLFVCFCFASLSPMYLFCDCGSSQLSWMLAN